ncbi:MAG: amidohydrolase family protein [Marinilabiliales bacterium]|nr:amidohydrolase family protein [Marinilabiliales bacterium]
MRKISAHLVFDGRGGCYPKAILTLDDEGTLLSLERTEGELKESSHVEFFSGALMPGFVNAHCHLELSHLKGLYPKHSGMVAFLKQVVENRAMAEDEMLVAAEKADLAMFRDGIAAVGDISNGTSSFPVKSQSALSYFTFAEALGFLPERAELSYQRVAEVVEQARAMGLKAVEVPHASYSVSEPLFARLREAASQTPYPVSIHNQESAQEEQFFLTGDGAMAQHLTGNLGLDISGFVPSGRSSLQTILERMSPNNPLLLVHNLHTSQKDIDYLKTVRRVDNTWFVLCPGSNLYIQQRLPDVPLFRRNGLQICLGTDSLASNDQLSILGEMVLLHGSFPDVPLAELVSWATYDRKDGSRKSQTDRRFCRQEINLIESLWQPFFLIRPFSDPFRAEGWASRLASTCCPMM